jgi:signal transduction histidine kinase
MFLTVWLPIAVLAAQAAALLALRRHAIAALIAVSALDFLLMAVSAGELGVGALAVIIASYLLARRGPPRRAYAVLGATAVVAVVVGCVTLAQGAPELRQWLVPLSIARALLGYGVPAGVAAVVGIRRRLLATLRERAELAEQARERAAADAVRQERALMARELHDIAAHHLTGIIVSTQAARMLAGSDPGTADGYLAVVEREARTTLDNLRQAVGLLRTDQGHAGEAAELAPQPSLEDAGELVAAFPAADISLTTTGAKPPLGPLAELTCYRMIQESLTNAVKHAHGAACRVEIAYEPALVRITVANGAAARAGVAASAAGASSSAPGGHGLLGMRERAALLGGALETGPSAEGGWRNVLTLPAEAAPREAAASGKAAG